MIFIILISIYFLFLILLAIKFALKESFKTDEVEDISISVLIPFKNEGKNIKNLIAGLKNQNFNENLVEYILINDNSTDESYNIAKVEIKDDDRFILLNLENQNGKKQALIKALKYSKNEIIVHTDADVFLQKNWLKTIANFYKQNKFKLALAPVLYKNEKSIFQKIQSLEITNIAGITAGSALINKPLMANGANIAYHKSIKALFIESVNANASGDDMFFLEKVLKNYPNEIKFIKSEQAIVYTYAEKTIGDFVNQRLRWMGKTVLFKNPFIVSIGLFTTLINFIAMFGFIGVLLHSHFIYIYLLFLSIKFIAEAITTILYVKYFKKINLIYLMPILFIIYPFYIVIIGVASLFIKTKWKGL